MAKVNIDTIKTNPVEVDKKNSKDKKVKPILSKDDLVKSKKPFGYRILSYFIDEDDIGDVKGYFLHEIVAPRIKDTAIDMFESVSNVGLDVLYDVLFHEDSRGRSHRRRHSRRDRRDYTRFSKRHKSSRHRRGRERDRDRDRDYDSPSGRYYSDEDIDYRNLVVKSRSGAEDIVDRMREMIEEDGQASIADLLNLFDLPSEFTDQNWGWYRENDIGIRRVDGGFLIDVARVKELED